MIPFKYGEAVSGENFCGREELLRQLVEFIASGQNVVLHGDRRMGKTSLALEACRKVKGRKVLLVNLMKIKTVDALCKRLLQTILHLESSEYVMSHVVRALSSIRLQIGTDPVTGLPTASIDAKEQLQADSIPKILGMIQKLHSQKPLVVILDEFQDILEVDNTDEALALLRGEIQLHAGLPYLFTGSSRKQMETIFSSYQSPFFKSAIPLTVGPLPAREFTAFLQKKFAAGNRKVADDVMIKIFKIANQVTGDIQQLCEAIWNTTEPGQEIDSPEYLAGALDLIFAREQSAYEILIGNLSAKQLQVLTALARLGGIRVTSLDFIQAVGKTTPSYVKATLMRMIQLGIVHYGDDEYRFFNPFFRMWILQRYNG